MKISQLFQNKERLEGLFKKYLYKKLLQKKLIAISLSSSHIRKAYHNLKFVETNLQFEEFNDWSIVGLYYAIYHAALALVAKKGYSSKSHNATLVFLIRKYSLDKNYVDLINKLYVSKEDAELYSTLKDKRQNASYSTNTMFRKEKIIELKQKVKEFIIKAEMIID